MATVTRNRRRLPRVPIPRGAEATVAFRYPEPGGPEREMPLRDLSAMGISFVLTDDLPGLEPGAVLRGARVRLGDETAAGEIVVMHVTPDERAGSICGALFYAEGGRDLHLLVERARGAAR